MRIATDACFLYTVATSSPIINHKVSNMPSFSLAVHTIAGSSKGRKLRLNEAADSGATPRTLLQDIFRHAPTEHHKDDADERALQFTNLVLDEDSITGTLKQGGFGTSAAIINVDDGELAHDKKRNEAEMFPYFFSVWLPDGAPSALVTSLRVSHDGIVGVLAKYLREQANELDEGINFRVESVVDSQLFDRLIDSSDVKKIRIIRYSLPSDVSDYLGYSSLDPEEFEFEISIKPKGRAKGLPKNMGIVRRFINLGNDKYDKTAVSRIIAIPGHEGDNLKLETKTRTGRTKTYDAMRSLESPMLYEIGDDVTIGDDGLPTPDSLMRYTKEIRDDFQVMMSG